MDSILTVENLTKSFGKLKVVDDLSFEVNRGEILGIIGPNGAGKTVLFSLLSGQLKPDSGRTRFNGRDVTQAPLYKRCRLGIGRAYQVPRLFADMTVLGNLLVGSIYGGGMGSKVSREKCEEILEETGLLSKKDLLVGPLKLLDRKRLELARALATCPSLLLVDEVAGGLTEPEVEDVLKIINRVRKDGITVLWVEHVLTVMKKAPDRLIVMNFGKKLFSGSPEEAFKSPEVKKSYLGDEEA